MAQFKNKVYSNTSKGSSRKDVNSYWYHRTQELKQDKLIKQWQESKGKSSNTQGWQAGYNTAVEKLGNN